METIFHEKQEGSLCAQHCLNALLQGAYFTPVDLSSLAQRMDEEERLRMAESGVETEEYRRFLQQPSGNMDDSGYFSIQVISAAVEVWGLELVPYTSTDERVREALTDPTKMQAFICNYKDHWFTVRRIGKQWFNLNSLLSKPQLISDTYLSLFLAQLKNEGYSIFVVLGELPECVADQVLKSKPILSNKPVASTSTITSTEEDDPELQAALHLSLIQDNENINGVNENDPNDEDLKRALRLSLQQENQDDQCDDDEEMQLRRAIEMSLECKSRTPSVPATPCDPEEIRGRRLAFLNRTQKM